MTAAQGFSPGRARALDSEEARFVLAAQEMRAQFLTARGWLIRVPGADGVGLADHPRRGLRLIHSICREADGEVWAHVSVSRSDRKLPSWEETRDVFREVCGDDALGVIVVAPTDEHVNRSEVHHVWCCLTRRAVPDFTRGTRSI